MKYHEAAARLLMYQSFLKQKAIMNKRREGDYEVVISDEEAEQIRQKIAAERKRKRRKRGKVL